MNSAEIYDSASERLQGIIIGVGCQGLKHARTVHAFRGAEIVGIADPSDQARMAFHELFPQLAVPAGYGVGDVLDRLDEPPDFAIVAVPHDTYPDIIKELCARRIAFLQEKPFARNLAEAHRIMETPGITQYGFTAVQRRYGRLDKDLCQLFAGLDSAPLGSFQYTYKLGLAQANVGWRGDKLRAGGGCMIDMGYHALSRIVDWLGIPDVVETELRLGSRRVRPDEAEDSASLSFEYPSGLRGSVALVPASDEKVEHFSIALPEGIIVGSTREATLLHNGEPLRAFGAPGEDLLLAQLGYFFECVRSREGFAENQAHHLAVMQLVEQCYQSQM